MTEDVQNKKSIWLKLKRSPFLIKLVNWEYWATSIVYIPVVPMWLYFSAKARSFTYFSAVNPGMKMGGLVLASKYDILKRIPEEFVPRTILVEKDKADLAWIENSMLAQKISYPVVAKPNMGERGLKVEKIDNPEELQTYLAACQVDFLVQEFIRHPNEIGILYHRYPDSKNGAITSVCLKETMKVTGDGISSLEELMESNPRAKLQIPRLLEIGKIPLDQVLKNGEVLELEPIGNHCRGTLFLDGNHLIDDDLTAIFDKISLRSNGLYYGRFDIKYNSLEELKAGENFKIMEMNGVASEPAHIYQPGYSLFRAYKDFFRHWRIIYDISEVQKAKGIPFVPFPEGIKSVFQYFSYVRKAKA